MKADKLKTSPNTDEEFNDPYRHTLSTEKFVENVERVHQEDKNDGLTLNEA
ncbi:hypothetical protein [Spirosoma pulveris]